MQYVLLQRLILLNPDTTGPAYLVVEKYWDTIARTYHATQQPAASGTAFELAENTEVQRVTLTNGKNRIFFYAGDGRVQTRRQAGTVSGGSGAVCTLTTPELVPSPASTSDAGGGPDAAIDVLPKLGAPPYQLAVQGPGGYAATKAARSAIYPIRFYNLPAGSFDYLITDALGCQAKGSFVVTPGFGVPYGPVLEESYYGDPTNGTGAKVIWNTNSLQVETHQYNGGGTDGYYYQDSGGRAIDGFFLPDGVTFRRVYSDGNNGVYFRDSTEANTGSPATLDNLILFHPDTAAEQNGGVLVEVNSVLPPSFTLTGLVGGVAIAPQTNATGSFDGLAAGEYEVLVNGTLKVPFALKLRYGLRWRRHFADPRGVPQLLELWLLGYAGPVEDVKGNGDHPVVLKTEGLNGTLGGQGDVPAVVGTSCEMSLRVLPGTLKEAVVGDNGDRACRCDVYSAGRLQFRGYVQPDIYTEPLLAGLQPISLTATDGLAGLKETDFLGHVGQRLQGRRPLLNTLLHALSRCDVSLPVQFFVNRRSTEMGDDEAPELAATTERNGYWQQGKGEPQDLRTVADALAQALGGTLCQREGTWQVRSLLEALDDAPGRAYRPAGTVAGPLKAVAPTGTIRPLARPGTVWGWRTAKQQQQVRPGWKSLAGKTDAGWGKNAFPAGEVFSDKYSWLADGSRLRPIAGWLPSPAGFPLVLVQGGEKGTDYATQLPRSTLFNTADDRYLESPALPLVAAPEGCPAYLSLTAKLIPESYLTTGVFPAVAGTAQKCTLQYELVVDGQRPADPIRSTFELAGNITAKETTITTALPALPAGARTAVLRLYAWYAVNADLLLTAKIYDPTAFLDEKQVIKYDFGTGVYRLFESQAILPPNSPPTGLPGEPYYVELPADDHSTGRLLLTSVGIELRPQQATWDGEDNFRADGPGGSVRPTEALDVYHPDVPIQAGLFEGNRHAFSKAVALADGSLSTAWARAIDLKAAPLFESNVYDSLALREGQSRLLTGQLSHHGHAGPLLLDSVDTPFDVPGRRFGVASTEWNLRLATTEVSLVEIGPGADAPDPIDLLPEGTRVIHQVYEYKRGFFTPVVRVTQDGRVRVRHV